MEPEDASNAICIPCVKAGQSGKVVLEFRKIGRDVQLANKLAAIPIRYEKIGTATARTKAAAFMINIKMVQVPHPTTVWLCKCLELRNSLININFAAVCAYKLPAIRKFGMAIANAAFCHLMGRELKDGDATPVPI